MGENISTRVAYGRALAEVGADENIYVFDADLKKCTMTLYFSEKYPERFYNIGIAEANMVDVAAGFATCGATALVHTFAIFAAGRVYDQVRNNVCYPGLNVKVVGSHAGLTVGEDGATHQALEDISLMRTIPGMTVIVPCDANETRLATKAMLDFQGPCYFRTGRPAETLLHYTLSAGKSTDSKSLDFFSLKTKKTAVFPYIFRKSCCIFLSVSLTFMQSASYQTGCCKDLRRSLSLQAALHGCPAR